MRFAAFRINGSWLGSRAILHWQSGDIAFLVLTSKARHRQFLWIDGNPLASVALFGSEENKMFS